MASGSDRDLGIGVATKHAAEDSPELPRVAGGGEKSADTSGIADNHQDAHQVPQDDVVTLDSVEQVTEALATSNPVLETIKEEIVVGESNCLLTAPHQIPRTIRYL
jgi:hypothetical protein